MNRHQPHKRDIPDHLVRAMSHHNDLQRRQQRQPKHQLYTFYTATNTPPTSTFYTFYTATNTPLLYTI